MQIDQLLLGQSSLLFSQRIFLLMSKLSLSFLDSLPATLFLLELIYDAWTHICFSVQASQNSFRSKCAVSLEAFCMFIQAKVAVLSTLICIEVSDNVTAKIFTAKKAAAISNTLI